jgi:hypothetical protein
LAEGFCSHWSSWLQGGFLGIAVHTSKHGSNLGLQKGVPKQFIVPAKEWLLSNNFPIIASVINRAAGNYGYGDYTQIPAVSYIPSRY